MDQERILAWTKSLNVTASDTLHWKKNYYKLHGYDIRTLRWAQLFKCNLRRVVHYSVVSKWRLTTNCKTIYFEENAIDLYYYLNWILGRNMLLGWLISCICHSCLISGFLQDVVSLLWQLCVFLFWTELWIRYKLFRNAKCQRFITRLPLWLARDCGLVRR